LKALLLLNGINCAGKSAWTAAHLRWLVRALHALRGVQLIAAMTLAASLANIHGGKGGYWEDEGYEWYAGI